MRVQLTNCGPTVSERDIAAFEQRVGVTLPDSYRRFLLEVNGGDGPVDDSGYPPDMFWSLNWLGGPISEEDVAALDTDMSWWWEDYDRRDLEFGVRGHWSSGLPRTWLPVGAANHEFLVLIRLEDASVWHMDLAHGVGVVHDEDRCERVAGSFAELGLSRR